LVRNATIICCIAALKKTRTGTTIKLVDKTDTIDLFVSKEDEDMMIGDMKTGEVTYVS